MTEPPIEADINLLPIGMIVPFPKGEVHKDFLEFNGQTIKRYAWPALSDALELLEGEGLELFEAWGGSINKDNILLPDLKKDQVVEMIWGVKSDGYDAVLAIRGKRSDT